MFEFLMDWFGERFYMPHGHCYLWQPAMVWLQVLSNLSIGLAYLAITGTLVYLVRKSRDIPFSWMYVAFAIFIVTCGLTHFSDVLVIWYPAYYLDGALRAMTAVASVATAILLPPLVPKAIALTEAARVSHERGIQLEEANKNLAQLLDKTKELEQLKTNFFANVSHELRTPLALVLGPTEKLLARTDLDGDARRELDVIARNARTLLKHVNDLLDVSKLEAGRMTAQYERIDLARLTRLVAGHFDGVAAERDIRFDVRTSEALPLEGDPDQLQRVLLNLLSNAFKFTPSGGRVRCELEPAQDRVRLIVADSGPGIRPEQRAAVFERFRQLDGGTTRRFGGTGLGLAIAHDFVELHAGTIEIEDAPEGGAQFVVTLPRRAPEGARVREASSENASSVDARQLVEELHARTEAIAVAAGGVGKPRVLIAEDNDEMRRFVAESLGDSYDVTTARDGREAHERALAAPPDLIISDVMMPAMSGDELVRALRQDERFDAVPIMLLTAKGDDELRVRMLREGAQDYMLKPFSVEELRARAGNLTIMKRAREVLQRELDTQFSDLERLASEVTQRKRELSTALESMRVARAQAESASRAKSSFLGLVSHELRTPLGVLELQLERLRSNEELTDAQRQLVERMSRTAGRLTSLIESLLTHARMQAHSLVAEVETFSLHDVARQVADELAPRAESKRLVLRVEGQGSERALASDPRLVRLVLVNLIDNAIKYTVTGEVRVLTQASGAGHAIVVSDTGPGIAPEEQVRLFQPFEHGEAISRKTTAGMGLGLTLVRDMVSALGGTMELASVVGKGTTLTVRLPDLPLPSAHEPPAVG